MSLNISLTTCQKVCLTIPGSCNVIEPYVWVSSNPSIVTVSSNDTNAIIRGVYGVPGTARVTVFDSLGAIVFVIYVTVIDYLNTTVPNPSYKYNLSSQVFKIQPTTGTLAIISGPLNYFINPATVGLCLIAMPIGASSFINSGIFLPNSTNSTIQLNGSFNVPSTTLSISFGLFQPVIGGTDIDPLLPFASTFTTNATNPGQPVQDFDVPIFPCDTADYISFVMLFESTGFRKITASRYIGGKLQYQFNLINPSTFYTASAIIVPLNYFNAASTSIIYTATVQVVVPTTLATQTVNFTIPSIPVGTCWFAQQSDMDNTKLASIDVLRAGNSAPTSLAIDYNRLLPGSGTFIANISIIAYKTQSVPGLSLAIF